MKTTVFKKGVWLLIAALLMPTYQKAMDAAVAGMGGFLILLAAVGAGMKSDAKEMAEDEARNRINSFFDEAQTTSLYHFTLALIKYDMPVTLMMHKRSPERFFDIVQENIQKLPEDLQKLFPKSARVEFCSRMLAISLQVTQKTTERASQTSSEISDVVEQVQA